MNHRSLYLLLACLCSLLLGAGRNPGFIISFHPEGDEVEGKRKVLPDMVEGKKVYFHRVPVVTHKNIVGYWEFPGDDGQSYGAAFLLNSAGYRELETLAITGRGRLLRAAVNRRPVDVLRIDSAPQDRVIVIWKGITEKEIKKIAKKLPRLGGAPQAARR
jgi:hypothetical protein